MIVLNHGIDPAIWKKVPIITGRIIKYAGYRVASIYIVIVDVDN